MRRRGAGGGATLMVSCGLRGGACAGAGRPTGTSSPGTTTHVVATFTAVDGGASVGRLTQDAHELTVRLHTFDDAGASASVRDRAVVGAGKTRLPVPASVLVAPGFFQIRPALCQAGPYAQPKAGTVVGALPTTCSSSRYSLQEPNLIVNTSTGTSNLPSIAPYPVLSSYPSSSPADNDSRPAGPVLVPATGAGGIRYLLGPAELNGTAVAGAQATKQYNQWFVDVTFTHAGASAWDALAEKYFHELIAMDLDGQAVSVPLGQPTESTFASFGGRMDISGNFSKQTAEEVAAVLDSGPLTTPLTTLTRSP